MRGTKRTMTTAVAVTGALSLVAAACGGDDDSAGGATVASTTAVTADHASPTPTSTAAPDDDHDHDDHDHDDESAHNENGGEPDSDPIEHDEAQIRLFIADAGAPQAAIFDLGSNETVDTIELDGIASVATSTSENGRFVYAAHDESVTIVDGGVWAEPHGGHAHHYSADPAVLGTVEGPRPTHLVSHDGIAALFFDGTGDAALLDEADLDHGVVAPYGTVESEGPHHGFVVPLGDDFIATSIADGSEGLPSLVGVRAADGQLGDAYECAETHGEGAAGDVGLAACADGVLVITPGRGGQSGELVPYPDVDDADPWGYGSARAWSLVIDPAVPHAAAPFGSRHVLWFEPDTGHVEAFQVAPPEDDVVVAEFGVAIMPVGDVLAVLTTDGTVRTVSTDDGGILAEAQVVEPFAQDETTERWPRLMIAGDNLLAADPYGGQIVELDSDDLSIVDTIEPAFDFDAVQVLGG